MMKNMRNITVLTFAVFITVFSGNLVLAQSANTLKNPSVFINKGDKYAHSYAVTLELRCEGASQMLISQRPDFLGAGWIPFQTELKYPVHASEGQHSVYVKFRDKDGNETELVSDDILVDTQPPQNPQVKIQVPGGHIRKKDQLTVNLSVSADDAKYVMVSNQPTFYGQKWRVYESNVLKDWKLEDGDDGPRTVYAKFRDIAGNETQAVSDRVVLDTQPPVSGEVVLNKGEPFFNDPSRKMYVRTFIHLADSMIVSTERDFDGAQWQAYADHIEWPVPEEDEGPLTLFVKFKDMAGNESKVFSDKITVDYTPPTDCEMMIDGGNKTTAQVDKLVILQFKAKGATQMMVSNHPLFKTAKWIPFKPVVRDWQLEGEEDGPRTVYAKFRDEAGNTAATVKATITVDRIGK